MLPSVSMIYGHISARGKLVCEIQMKLNYDMYFGHETITVNGEEKELYYLKGSNDSLSGLVMGDEAYILDEF